MVVTGLGGTAASRQTSFHTWRSDLAHSFCEMERPRGEELPGTGVSDAPRALVNANRVLIRPVSGWVALNLGELWEYRELLYFLVWRDVKVRYRQTLLGVAWAILQPALAMLVFTLVFGYLARVPSEGTPYPVFTFSALLPWQLFAHSLTQSSNSLVTNERLLTKVYFPRLVVPLSSVLSGLVDFFFAFLVLLAMIVFYGVVPGWAVWTLPFFVLFALMAALGIGLWLSALNVQYRDVRYAVPFLTQLWLFVTPIAYPSSLIPARWRLLYGLNPMTGVVEGFRWALLGKADSPGVAVLISLSVVCMLLVGGLYYFRRMEKNFADLV